MSQSSAGTASAEQSPLGTGAQAATSSRHAYLIVALAVVVLCALYHRMPGSLGHPLDDGYISLHSAQVLHWGKDPNFPNTAPLVDIRNAPYVLLLWALLPVLPPLAALQVASWLGVLCYGLGLVALGRAFRLPLPSIVALAALGLTIAKVPYQLLNGVETGMAMGITAWIFALAKSNTVWSRRGASRRVVPQLGQVYVRLMPILIFGLISGVADRSAWVRRAAYTLLILSSNRCQLSQSLAAFLAGPGSLYTITRVGRCLEQ